MSIPLILGFERGMDGPIDIDLQKPNISARNAITKRWEGMTCYVISEQKTYSLVGGTENSNWQLFGQSGATAQTGLPSGITQYLTATASGIAGYNYMQDSPDGAAEVLETVAVKNSDGWKTLDNYIGLSPVGLATIAGGVWNPNLWVYVDSDSGTTLLKAEFYSRDISGVETLLFSITSDDINWTTPQQIPLFQSVQQSVISNIDDKIVMKLLVSTTHANDVNFTLVHSGTQHYSYINTPLAIPHNSLAGLQGGATGQMNHLTNAQVAIVDGVTSALQQKYNATNPDNFINLTNLSSSATGLTYNNTTGVFSLTSGYAISTTESQSRWDAAYTSRISSLTTIGNQGAASVINNTLNIPNYTPTTTTIGTLIGDSTNKATFTDSDSLAIRDIVTGLLQQVSGINLKVYLKTYFDGLYSLLGGVHQNSQSGDYTFVLSDAGKDIYHPSGDTAARTWTIPSNVSVAFPIGTMITITNGNGAGLITLTIASDTLYKAGTGSTGAVSIYANGMITIKKETATVWRWIGALS